MTTNCPKRIKYINITLVLSILTWFTFVYIWWERESKWAARKWNGQLNYVPCMWLSNRYERKKEKKIVPSAELHSFSTINMYIIQSDEIVSVKYVHCSKCCICQLCCLPNNWRQILWSMQKQTKKPKSTHGKKKTHRKMSIWLKVKL